MPGYFCEAKAYPTIGLILLGGISNNVERMPLHDSAGFAYTLADDSAGYVSTRVLSSHIWQGFVNGKEIDASDSRSPFKVIRQYYDSMRRPDASSHDSAFSFYSENIGILSGSSDAAAASFGKCIEEFSREALDRSQLENKLRGISESVGRSLKGGLTCTIKQEGNMVTEKLLDAESFSNYRVVGCNFSVARNPSDNIHSNIVKDPDYGERIKTAKSRVEKIRKLAETDDVKGIFELAEKDTEDYHRIIERCGVTVITPEMRKLINFITELKKEIWVTYIVTGGSNVFAVVDKNSTGIIIDNAKKFGFLPHILKVAGSPVTVSKNF